MKRHILKWLSLGMLLMGGLLSPPDSLADGNIVLNGGFNSPNGTTIPGWTYPGFMWDYGNPPGADGGAFVGLSEYISQVLPTQPRQSYLLQFSIRAALPFIGQGGPYGIGVSWDSQAAVVYDMTSDLNSWIMEQEVVTASSAGTLLEFTQPYGAMPYLDAVSVTAIPEPRVLSMLILALGLVVPFRSANGGDTRHFRTRWTVNKGSEMRPNPAHPLDGGIPSLLHIGRRWPAASDERR